DRPPVRVPEAGRRGVAVRRDDGQTAPARGREDAELRRSGAEDENPRRLVDCHGAIVAAAPVGAAGEPSLERGTHKARGGNKVRPLSAVGVLNKRLVLVLAAPAYG